jgi:tRNA-Thr(GGU) m(6)t(6)A37 methyltransferase TsaA
MKISIEPIGFCQSPFTELVNMPVQPKGGSNQIGKIILKKEFQQGLKDLDGFSHIYLIYYFHKIKQHKLEVIPFNDKTNSIRGVFSTRTPMHPNKLGLSIVELISINDNILTFKGVDILDKTPIIDIKPYIENFDKIDVPTSSGWMKSTSDEVSLKKSDTRFIGK